MNAIFHAAIAVLGFSVLGHAATIKGAVKFAGTAAKSKEIKMSADPGCVKATGGKAVFAEKEVVAANGGVKWAIVYIKSGATPSKPSTTPVVLNQNGCRYEPHVLAVQAGQPIEVLNSDSLLHNVHSMAKKNKAENFNMGMAVKGQKLTKSFSKAEFPPIKVKCDVHGWMNSYIAVTDNPYFAVTNDKGEFTINDVPPGNYTVEVWHEEYKTKEAPVSISAATDSKDVNFEFNKSNS